MFYISRLRRAREERERMDNLKHEDEVRNLCSLMSVNTTLDVKVEIVESEREYRT